MVRVRYRGRAVSVDGSDARGVALARTEFLVGLRQCQRDFSRDLWALKHLEKYQFFWPGHVHGLSWPPPGHLLAINGLVERLGNYWNN